MWKENISIDKRLQRLKIIVFIMFHIFRFCEMSNPWSGHPFCWYYIIFVWHLHIISVEAATPTLSYSLLEESPTSTFVGNLSSSFKSNISNVGNNTWCTDVSVPSLRYSLLPGQWSTSFNLDSKSGILRSNSIMNRESICLPHAVECVVEIQAAIVQPIECFRVFQIDIVIVDINDNSPTFPTKEMSISVTSGSKPETSSPFRLPSAEDLDSGIFGVQRYGLVPNSSYFTVQWISSENGVGQLFLILTRELPKVNPDPFQFTVVAFDGGIPPRTGQLLIDVLIQTTQHGPIFDFQVYNVTVTSDIAPWTSITTVHASTSDPLGKIVYSIGDQTVNAYGGLFAVGNTSGEIYTTRPIQVPTVDTYTLQIQAEDDNTPPYFDYTTVC